MQLPAESHPTRYLPLAEQNEASALIVRGADRLSDEGVGGWIPFDAEIGEMGGGQNSRWVKFVIEIDAIKVNALLDHGGGDGASDER